ncbi:energy-coupling factor ABC transporter ATP-binding protein [Corynebacterium gerontici]|uniref:ABC transporter ATP-binding protein n=1 Tax=Corynebacterium gerontici TaxID=2079234 RepID=A0A3G6J260_9CORY|nr:ABC transporter ATP-binding protein [Corynebacterium gerontici]AZA11058.1 Energy-coupling factor transporter ATP-binding protein EcfA3 [Corynebacterium gerontici]
MGALIEAEYLHFQREDRTILRDVSLTLRPGERVALLGANGVGKSTLMRMLAGAWQPSAGRVLVDARPVQYNRKGRDRVRQRVQMVLQEPDDQIFATSVAADVSYGPMNLGLDEAEVRKRVEDALEATGIQALAQRVPHQLSFGQRKRVALAGALAMHPAALLLDEPTAGLDPRGTEQLLAVLERLSEQGTALLFATHDVNAAVTLAQRIIVLVDGRAHEGGIHMLTDEAFVEHAGLALPWAPLVSQKLGRNITTPRDLL